ncbi:MAG: hypothetical protein ABJZ69_11620 [Hyphomicrobiales bacterium]
MKKEQIVVERGPMYSNPAAVDEEVLVMTVADADCEIAVVAGAVRLGDQYDDVGAATSCSNNRVFLAVDKISFSEHSSCQAGNKAGPCLVLLITPGPDPTGM